MNQRRAKCSKEGSALCDMFFPRMHLCSGSLMVSQSTPESGSQEPDSQEHLPSLLKSRSGADPRFLPGRAKKHQGAKLSKYNKQLNDYNKRIATMNTPYYICMYVCVYIYIYICYMLYVICYIYIYIYIHIQNPSEIGDSFTPPKQELGQGLGEADESS